jgi:tetratricopeptide (TPR) repeat protein
MLSFGRKDEAKLQTSKISARAFATGREALAKGDYGTARTAFRWARRADPGNPLYIHGEAVVAHRTGNFYDAEHLYRRVLDLAMRAFGAGDPRIALAARGLIELCRQQGRYEEAWTLGKYVVDSLDRAAAARAGVASLSSLVKICDAIGRLDEAVALHRKALAWRSRVYGEGHYKVQECIIAIAELNRLIAIRGKGPAQKSGAPAHEPSPFAEAEGMGGQAYLM